MCYKYIISYYLFLFITVNLAWDLVSPINFAPAWVSVTFKISSVKYSSLCYSSVFTAKPIFSFLCSWSSSVQDGEKLGEISGSHVISYSRGRTLRVVVLAMVSFRMKAFHFVLLSMPKLIRLYFIWFHCIQRLPGHFKKGRGMEETGGKQQMAT